MKITWQQRMTDKRVVEMAGINEISCEVRQRHEVELLRTCTQERVGERLFYSIVVDSRRTKSERETKDHLERNFGRERETRQT